MAQALTLQKADLVKQLDAIATEQKTTTQELLNQAVSEFLDKVARQKIHQESKAFKTMHPELVINYKGKYVAIHHGQIVDSDEDNRTLYLRIRKQYGGIAVLIRQVTDKAEQELVFRSPRLRQVNL